jgi:hypothetical protein
MPRHPRAALPALGALLVLAACGGGNDAAADSTAAVAPVGSYQDAADSALRAGSNTIDSLKQAGQTPASGLDSASAVAGRNARDTTGMAATGATAAPSAPGVVNRQPASAPRRP